LLSYASLAKKLQKSSGIINDGMAKSQTGKYMANNIKQLLLNVAVQDIQL